MPVSNSFGSPVVTHACPYFAASFSPRGPVAATAKGILGRWTQPGMLRASTAE